MSGHTATSPSEGGATHWDAVHRGDEAGRSWFQSQPTTSLRLIRELCPDPSEDGTVVDVGAGTSRLVDGLLAAGHRDVTLVDVSAAALDRVRDRLGVDARVHTVAGDVLAWQPERTFDVWHDRATLHFLIEDDELTAYAALARTAVAPGGHAVIATFASDGPSTCSALPVRGHDAAGLAALFEPGFELVHSERQEHTTPRGEHQPFTWVVLRRRDA